MKNTSDDPLGNNSSHYQTENRARCTQIRRVCVASCDILECKNCQGVFQLKKKRPETESSAKDKVKHQVLFGKIGNRSHFLRGW